MLLRADGKAHTFDDVMRHDFLDAVTSNADRAVALFESMFTFRRTALREAEDWKTRFKDRDAYAKLLEAELRPIRAAELERAKALGEQEALI
jgi:hypothetical protein